MANDLSTEVVVTRKARDGWFVYTCDDLPGLYVAHQNDQVAYDDIPEAIRLLVKLNEGIDCLVSHTVSYAEFVERIHRSHDDPSAALQRRTQDLMADHPEMLRFMLRHDEAHQGR